MNLPTANNTTENRKKVIQIEHLNKSFGENKVLIDFNLELKAGENIVVLGKSGSGKSYMTKLEILRTLMFDTDVIVLDPEKEYEYLSVLGDWNGGVSLDHLFWALPDQQVLSPDTRNPTPVRSHTEVQFAPVNFYCVK
jgi:ATPase subunit of ABC transporter with duplicated ATPase domains